MTITTKYSIGDSVTGIGDSQANRIVKCVTCANTGRVTIQGDEFVCPKCNGQAKHPAYAGRKWFIQVDGATVGQVRTAVTDEQFCDYGDRRKIEYMLDETGIGSGTIWREEILFPSREEAQAECNLRNGLLLKDEA